MNPAKARFAKQKDIVGGMNRPWLIKDSLLPHGRKVELASIEECTIGIGRLVRK